MPHPYRGFIASRVRTTNLAPLDRVILNEAHWVPANDLIVRGEGGGVKDPASRTVGVRALNRKPNHKTHPSLAKAAVILSAAKDLGLFLPTPIRAPLIRPFLDRYTLSQGKIIWICAG
jgi:hypothetical protein